jgi:radical SAM/Cys-rich protein
VLQSRETLLLVYVSAPFFSDRRIIMAELTLLRRHSELANPAEQLRILEHISSAPRFSQFLAKEPAGVLQSRGLEVLQVNVGKVCNQTCHHCHVDAGPDRREAMNAEVAQACLRLLRQLEIPTLDITGGAPEMNPHFRMLVREARAAGSRVIDRCNLTILVAPGHEDLAAFLAEYQVEIVASLPCYLEENVDRQRGDRVFERSVRALRILNDLGYGLPESSLKLTLVNNPVEASLPPNQERLEADYRRELAARYGIAFTQLFTITNMPISRFLDDLLQRGQLENYMQKLVAAYNPATLERLMCRTMLSVDWQGNLYDCDFNQMLELPIQSRLPRNILHIDQTTMQSLLNRAITTGQHCFGCTAGAGSSCTGSLK